MLRFIDDITLRKKLGIEDAKDDNLDTMLLDSWFDSEHMI